jgi:putative heme-binding domain-containing protein
LLKSNDASAWAAASEEVVRTPFQLRSPFNLAEENDVILEWLAVYSDNLWLTRKARQIMHERMEEREDATFFYLPVAKTLEDRLSSMEQGSLKQLEEDLKYLWLRGGSSLPKANHGHERLRAAILRQTADDGMKKADLSLFAQQESSPIVRRELASALQRLPQDQRKDLATALLKHGEDKDDPMIPLLIWYGIEPVVAADAAVGLQLAKVSKMPKVTEFIYRRLAGEEAGIQGLLKLATESKDAALRQNLLTAVVQAARGGSKVSQPANWAAMREKVVSASAESGDAAQAATTLLLELEAHMGIEAALKHFRDQLALATAGTAARESALKVLLQAKDAATAKILLTIVSNDSPASLRRQAIQALASLKDAETPKTLGAALPKLSANELPDAVNTLASTKEGSKALLKAVEAKTVPATALSPFLVRQLTAFDDAEINALIKSAWGDVNAPKADLGERTKKYKTLLTPAALAKGDLAKGKMLYTATCGQCHKLFGEGQNVGPDITGSNRADLNYLLENVLDPNAVIGKAYQLNLFTMKDGRVMSGVIKDENPAAVTIAMMGGVEFTLPQADIAKREVSKLSTMPEGLFDALQPEMVIDLVKYLQSGAGGTLKREQRTVEGALEGETMKVLEITGGKTGRQGMGGFGSDWSGAAQLWWTGGKPDQKLTLAIPVKEAGKYTLYGALTMARDYGVVSIALDGKPVTSSFDGYNGPKVIHTGEKEWGTHELTTGEHKLTFTLAPPNPDAVPSNMVGLDYVRLEKK